MNDFNPTAADKDASTLKAYSQIDYAVKSEKVSGSGATVTASITAIDIKQAVGETVTYSIEMQFNGEWDFEDEADYQQAYMDYYNEYVIDPARTKITVDLEIELKNVDGVWKITPDKDFVNALTGFQRGTGSVGGAQ